MNEKNTSRKKRKERESVREREIHGQTVAREEEKNKRVE